MFSQIHCLLFHHCTFCQVDEDFLMLLKSWRTGLSCSAHEMLHIQTIQVCFKLGCSSLWSVGKGIEAKHDPLGQEHAKYGCVEI